MTKPSSQSTKGERSGRAIVLRESDSPWEDLSSSISHFEWSNLSSSFTLWENLTRPLFTELASHSVQLVVPGTFSSTNVWAKVLGAQAVLGEEQESWLPDALAKLAQISSGADKAYAELALRQANSITTEEPRIYNSPEGGVVIESRTDHGILTLLVENKIGLIVRSANEFHVRAEFDITARSINEILARHAHELRMLHFPPES